MPKHNYNYSRYGKKKGMIKVNIFVTKEIQPTIGHFQDKTG